MPLAILIFIERLEMKGNKSYYKKLCILRKILRLQAIENQLEV